MNPITLYSLGGLTLFSIGLYGFFAQAHLLRKILAFNIMGSGVSLLLIATAWRGQNVPPDPVPHALVLTGVVVAVSATAFALALVRRLHEETGAAFLPDEESRQEPPHPKGSVSGEEPGAA
jgi:multicomponent Na+:H+ antiporter subunit C